VEYGKSGLVKLMHGIGFDGKKPESAPAKIDAQARRDFIESHEKPRNSLGPDETVVYVDAVHPTHQSSRSRPNTEAGPTWPNPNSPC